MIASFNMRQYKYQKDKEEEKDKVKEFHRKNAQVIPTKASAYMVNRKFNSKNSPIKENKEEEEYDLHLKTRKNERVFPLKENSNIFNIQLLHNKFLQIQCNVSKNHGAYDFVCIDPKNSGENLVCIDCVKEDPEKLLNFQSNSEFFVRINKFFEICTMKELTFEQSEKVNEIERFQNKFKDILTKFDKEVEFKVEDLKNFFKEKEGRLIEIIKSRMREIFSQIVDDFKLKWDKVKRRVVDVKEKSHSITNFVNGEHLHDIERLVHNAKIHPKNVLKLDDSIKMIVKFRNDLDFLIDSWEDKVKRISTRKLEKELMPKIDFTSLSKIFKEKEILFRDEIDSILIERDDFEFERMKRFRNYKLTNLHKFGEKEEKILDTFRVFDEDNKDKNNHKDKERINRLNYKERRNREKSKKMNKEDTEYIRLSNLCSMSSPGKLQKYGTTDDIKFEGETTIKPQRKEIKRIPRPQRSVTKDKIDPFRRINEKTLPLNYKGKDEFETPYYNSKESIYSENSFYDPIQTCRLDEIDQKIQEIFGLSPDKDNFKSYNRDPLEEIKFLRKLSGGNPILKYLLSFKLNLAKRIRILLIIT